MSEGTTIHLVRGLRIAVTDLGAGWYGTLMKLGDTSFAARVGAEGEIAGMASGTPGQGHEFEETDWLPDEVQKAMRDAVRERRAQSDG